MKYIEINSSNRLVSWGSDIADGGNITIKVTPTDELISGYEVNTEPQLPTGARACVHCLSDVAVTCCCTCIALWCGMRNLILGSNARPMHLHVVLVLLLLLLVFLPCIALLDRARIMCGA